MTDKIQETCNAWKKLAGLRGDAALAAFEDLFECWEDHEEPWRTHSEEINVAGREMFGNEWADFDEESFEENYTKAQREKFCSHWMGACASVGSVAKAEYDKASLVSRSLSSLRQPFSVTLAQDEQLKAALNETGRAMYGDQWKEITADSFSRRSHAIAQEMRDEGPKPGQ